MNVFIIPSWHPTTEKPFWCNWVKPHIELVKTFANSYSVLHVDIENDDKKNVIMEVSPNHFYLSSPILNFYNRTLFYYGSVLSKFVDELDLLFKHVVSINGYPDIIHAHVSMPAGYGASIIGKKYNIPVIVTEHYSGIFSDCKFFWRLSKFYKIMLSNIQGFYCVSPGYKKLIENKLGFHVSGVTLNPVNCNIFSLTEKASNYSISDFNIITTGTIGSIKGTDILLKAIKILSGKINVQLTIVGKKSLDSKNWEILNDPDIKDNVKFFSSVDQKFLAQLYNDSKIFVVSSRFESANVSMLEAMSCGCHVISNNIEGPISLLNESVSSVYNYSGENLAKCILEIFNNNLIKPRNYYSDFIKMNYSIEVLASSLLKEYIFVIKK